MLLQQQQQQQQEHHVYLYVNNFVSLPPTHYKEKSYIWRCSKKTTANCAKHWQVISEQLKHKRQVYDTVASV